MRESIATRFTPQKKIIGVNNRLGNDGIKNQQGTTRVIYDSLPIDGRVEYNFFEGANNRDFPLTNLGSGGNRLEVGESMIIERCYLVVRQITDTAAGPSVDSISPMFPVSTNLASGDLSIIVANQQILKPISALSFLPEFNKDADNGVNNNFEFDTQLSIPPLTEFIMKYRTGTQAAIANTFLTLVIEGTGSILNVRTVL